MKAKLGSSLLFVLAAVAVAQHDHAEVAGSQQELSETTNAMAGHGDESHHMGPHMKMSVVRAVRPGDQERADEIVAATRAAMEKYKDPAAAEADGFKLFLPKVKHQKQYHYTNYRYAFQAAFRFDPAHPTSLLYADDHEGKKQLIGAMFTAPARFTEDQLHERIPLSVAQWHQHVNLCVSPREKRGEMSGPAPQFGLFGSISTKVECDAAGGTFKPRIFGWMVHLYPYEKTRDAMWSVERQRLGSPAAATEMRSHRH